MPVNGQKIPQSRLIIAPGGLTKTEHVIPDEEFVKLKRLMAWARGHGMVAMYFCEICKEPVSIKHDNPILFADGSGSAAPVTRVECGCSRWTIR